MNKLAATTSAACTLLGGCREGETYQSAFQFQRTNISQAVAEKVLMSLVYVQ